MARQSWWRLICFVLYFLSRLAFGIADSSEFGLVGGG
jgi:hypothetical protein